MRSFRKIARKKPVLVDKSHSKIAESYRSLRTNIGMCSLDSPPKTLMVTSAVPREGKTTTVINIGISFSQIGLRVLIVDTDMRNPMIHTFFDLEKTHGLTNALVSAYGINLKSGDIRKISIPDVFHIIRVRGKTGILRVDNSHSVFDIEFQNGVAISAEAQGENEKDFLLEIIKDAKRLSASQVAEIKQRGKETGKNIEFVILNLGLVKKDELDGFVRLKTSKILKDIFSLQEATFAFEEILESSTHKVALSEGDKEESELPLVETPYITKVIEEHVKQASSENLFVLSCGSLPQNPSEILSSHSFKEFTKKLTETFDLVIFDSPPITAVTDPSIIASQVDGVILIVRARMAHRNIIRFAKDQLAKSKANILGVVLNDIDITTGGYYYSRYGYGKYSGSDYGKYYGQSNRTEELEEIDIL